MTKPRLLTFRVLPVLVVAAALSLSVRVGDLWQDLGAAFGPGADFRPGAGVALAAEPAGAFEPTASAAPAPALQPASGPVDDDAVSGGEPHGARPNASRAGAEAATPSSAEAASQSAPQSTPGRFEPWTIAPDGQAETVAAEARRAPGEAASPAPEPSAGADLETTARPAPLVAALPDPYDLTDEEIALLQQLSARREQIERQRREVAQREALLAAAEARVEEKVSELEELRRTIEQLVIQHDEQEEAQLRSLVKIYENMKPKEAARIFEQLDMVVLLEVIDRMKERKAAPVLARMSPDRAQEITLELARRRNLPVAKN